MCFWYGALILARTHFEQSLALDESSQREAPNFYGHDTGVSACSYLACVL
jgi:hypothetical protein